MLPETYKFANISTEESHESPQSSSDHEAHAGLEGAALRDFLHHQLSLVLHPGRPRALRDNDLGEHSGPVAYQVLRDAFKLLGSEDHHWLLATSVHHKSEIFVPLKVVRRFWKKCKEFRTRNSLKSHLVQIGFIK